MSDAHDVLSSHHDSGFGDIQLFFGSLFKTCDVGLVALEVGIEESLAPLRALISPDVEDFQIDKSMVLGVWGNRARFLMPTAEKLPTSRRDRRGVFEYIIANPWVNWQEAITGDVNPLRVHYELQPWRICSHSPRAPPTMNLRSSGTHAEWRAQWNPSTHANPYPIGLECSVDWAR